MSGSPVKASSARSRRAGSRRAARSALALLGAAALAGAARAENLPDALSKAYFNNPNLNAQRSTTRAADENIPIANSGYMPHVAATGDLGAQYQQYSGPLTTNTANVSGTSGTSGSSSTVGSTGTGVTGSTGSSGAMVESG